MVLMLIATTLSSYTFSRCWQGGVPIISPSGLTPNPRSSDSTAPAIHRTSPRGWDERRSNCPGRTTCSRLTGFWTRGGPSLRAQVRPAGWREGDEDDLWAGAVAEAAG